MKSFTRCFTQFQVGYRKEFRYLRNIKHIVRGFLLKKRHSSSVAHILTLILSFQKQYGSSSQIVWVLHCCSNSTVTRRMNDQHKEFRVMLLPSEILQKGILHGLSINLLLFLSVQYEKNGVMIGQEDLATCFVQARIARRQAKSLLVVALFLKLTKEKLSCLNSQKKMRIGKS